MDNEKFPFPRRLEKIAEVARRIGFSRSWVYERLAAGDCGFPRPLKIRAAYRWDSQEIDLWIEDQVRRGKAGAPRQMKAPTDGLERPPSPSKRGL